jgi:hypothetical protein
LHDTKWDLGGEIIIKGLATQELRSVRDLVAVGPQQVAGGVGVGPRDGDPDPHAVR